MKLDKTITSQGDFPVLQPGTYDFEVEDAKLVKSSKGDDMWKIKLRFEQDNGPDVTVFENIVVKESMMWKFNAFFASVGMDADDTDKIKDAIGEVGKAKVVIEKGTNGYQDRNVVKSYLSKEKKAENTSSGDDLPF